jgi:two-component system, response regulator YesN
MYKFIIIDDEPLIRKGLLKKIQSCGCDLQFSGEADNGEDALELINHVNPDLIFTDMRMPIMDGKSLLRILQQDYPGIKIIVISGHSDFEYMQEAISAKVIGYLLKPFSREEIQVAVKKAVTAIENDQKLQNQIILKDIEKESISSEADMQTLLNLILGIHQHDQGFTFRSKPFRFINQAKRYVLMTLYSPVSIPVKEPSHEGDILYFPHPQSSKLFFALLAFQQEDADAVLLEQAAVRAEALIHLISNDNTNPFCVGFSRVKSNLLHLNQANQETITALNRRTIADHGLYYYYNSDDQAPDVLMWDRVPDLLFFVESGNTPKVIELILDFFAFYIRQPTVTISQLKDQCRVIIAEAKKLIAVYFPMRDSHTSSSSLESVLNVSFDLEEIQNYCHTVLSSSADLLKENTVYSSDNVIDNIKVYISKNYSRPLTLERFSALFFINPSYLSFLFKEKTGENLTDYINRERIEHAKLLLKNSNDKVYKVAKVLGYDNPKYFFRVFKKMTGYTPEEYRISCTKEVNP